MQYDEGYLADCKAFIPGLARPGTAVPPGKLHVHRWNTALDPLTPVVELFDGEAVYDFEAVLFGDDIAVLATGQQNALLTIGRAALAEVPRQTLKVGEAEGPLSMPALVPLGDVLHLLVVEHKKTPGARLLFGLYQRDDAVLIADA